VVDREANMFCFAQGLLELFEACLRGPDQPHAVAARPATAAPTAAGGGACYPVGLDIEDEPAAWVAAGFAVEPGGEVRLGELTLRLLGRPAAGGGGGVVCWRFANLPAGVDEVGGVPARRGAPGVGTGAHPNGAASTGR
jgi:hypothetical protein